MSKKLFQTILLAGLTITAIECAHAETREECINRKCPGGYVRGCAAKCPSE